MEKCAFEEDWRFLSQLLGFIFALIALITKRHTEKPQRDSEIWFLDISKQFVGGIVCWIVDYFFLSIIPNNPQHKVTNDIESCEDYFMYHMYDMVLCVMFNISVLYALKFIIIKYMFIERHKEFFRFGYYGEPFSKNLYLIQLAIWLLIVLSGKMSVAILFLVATPTAKSTVSRIAFSALSGRVGVEHILITFIIPIAITSVSFWLQDIFLQHDERENNFPKVTWEFFVLVEIVCDKLCSCCNSWLKRYQITH